MKLEKTLTCYARVYSNGVAFGTTSAKQKISDDYNAVFMRGLLNGTNWGTSDIFAPVMELFECRVVEITIEDQYPNSDGDEILYRERTGGTKTFTTGVAANTTAQEDNNGPGNTRIIYGKERKNILTSS